MLLRRVARFASRNGLWQPDTPIVAAVSGGSDSVAMLLLLHDLHVRGDLRLVAVAHLNHAIRAEATDDEAFCAALAGRLSVPFVTSRLDVPAIARQRRQSLELAGRVVRRAFLDDVRRAYGAAEVATAHTQDDQAETVLLRLLRGAGARGLGGIAPRRDGRVRPVLCATRAELVDELRRRGQPWCEDATNADRANPRNRVRHELLPYLEQHFNPSARRALARAADLARADDDWLAREAVAAGVAVMRHREGALRLDRAALLALPDALRGRIVQQAIGAARGTIAAGLQEVEVVLAVARGDRAGADLPNLRVEPSAGFVVLLDRTRAAEPAAFAGELEVPGTLDWTEAGVRLEASEPAAHQSGPPDPAVTAHGQDLVHVSADAIGSKLLVRSRRPGDRLTPLGLGGRKKVQDILVDAKVPRHARGLVPIVTTVDGRIVWVAGRALSDAFRITEGTKAVIALKLRRI